MRTQSVAWHKECLKNFLHSLAEKRKRKEELILDIARMEREAYFRQLQIDEATTMGKESFDGERYLAHKKLPPPL